MSLPPLPYATGPRCVRGCVLPGQHVPPGAALRGCGCVCHAGAPACDIPGGCVCTDPHLADCPGCLPRPAVPGGQVCVACWERVTDAVVELPNLYDELLTPGRVATGTGRVSGSTERALALADGPRWSRQWLRGVLWEWCWVLAGPAEPTQAQRSEWNAAAKRLQPGETLAPLPAAPYGRAITMPGDMDPHITGPVVVRHAEWLLTRAEYADQFCHDVLAVYADATRTAAPAAPSGVTLGRCPLPYHDPETGVPSTCGGTIRAHNSGALIRCSRCGRAADAWWWRVTLMAGQAPAGIEARAANAEGAEPTADGYALAAWLSAEHSREITPAVIRQWASAGTRHGRLARAGRSPQGRTLYPVADAQRIAAALYAPPPDPDPASEPEPEPADAGADQ